MANKLFYIKDKRYSVPEEEVDEFIDKSFSGGFQPEPAQRYYAGGRRFTVPDKEFSKFSKYMERLGTEYETQDDFDSRAMGESRSIRNEGPAGLGNTALGTLKNMALSVPAAGRMMGGALADKFQSPPSVPPVQASVASPAAPAPSLPEPPNNGQKWLQNLQETASAIQRAPMAPEVVQPPISTVTPVQTNMPVINQEQVQIPQEAVAVPEPYQSILDQQPEQTNAPQDFTSPMNTNVPAIDQTQTEKSEPGTGDFLGNAAKRGLLQAELAKELQKDAPDIQRIAEINRESTDLVASPAFNKFNQAKSFKETMQTLAKNPIAITAELITQSGLSQLSTLKDVAPPRVAAGAAGGGALGLAGGPFAELTVPAGLLIGGQAGFIESMGKSSFMLETSGKIMESLSDLGVDINNANALEKAFADKKLMKTLNTVAQAKGVPIAALDMFSAMIGGKLFKSPAGTLIGKAGAGAGELGVQMALGAGGEALGQKSAGEDFNVSAVVAEALGELGSGPAEIAQGRIVSALTTPETKATTAQKETLPEPTSSPTEEIKPELIKEAVKEKPISSEQSISTPKGQAVTTANVEAEKGGQTPVKTGTVPAIAKTPKGEILTAQQQAFNRIGQLQAVNDGNKFIRDADRLSKGNRSESIKIRKQMRRDWNFSMKESQNDLYEASNPKYKIGDIVEVQLSDTVKQKVRLEQADFDIQMSAQNVVDSGGPISMEFTGISGHVLESTIPAQIGDSIEIYASQKIGNDLLGNTIEYNPKSLFGNITKPQETKAETPLPAKPELPPETEISAKPKVKEAKGETLKQQPKPKKVAEPKAKKVKSVKSMNRAELVAELKLARVETKGMLKHELQKQVDSLRTENISEKTAVVPEKKVAIPESEEITFDENGDPVDGKTGKPIFNEKGGLNEAELTSEEKSKVIQSLESGEQKIKDRIAKRKQEGRLYSGIDPEATFDYAALGAIKIAKGVVNFTEWSTQMIKEFGDAIKPHLKKIYSQSLIKYRRELNTKRQKTPKKEFTAKAQSEIMDEWFADADERTQQGNIETAKIQRRIKDSLGKKLSMIRAKKVDKAIQLNIDLRGKEGEIRKYFDTLTSEQQETVTQSQNLTPEQIKIADDLIAINKEIGEESLDKGVINNVIDNYTMRLWDFDTNSTKSPAFSRSTKRAKPRKLSSILEGWSKGYKLKINGASTAHQVMSEQIARTIANNQLIENGKGLDVFSTTHFEGWEKIDNPAFSEYAWRGQKEEGAVYGRNFFISDEGAVFEKTSLYAPEQLANKLNDIIGNQDVAPTMEKIEKFNAVTKSILLTTSLFHHQAYIRSYLIGSDVSPVSQITEPIRGIAGSLKYILGGNPLKLPVRAINPFGQMTAGIKNMKGFQEGQQAIINFSPEIKELVRGGLTLGKIQDWNEAVFQKMSDNFRKKFDNIPVARSIVNKITDFRDEQTRILFQEIGPSLKAQAALLEYKHELKKSKKAIESGKDSVHDVALRVAKLINDDFGGLHHGRLGRSQRTTRLLNVLELAQDWTHSNVRSMVKTIVERNPDTGKMQLSKGYEGKIYRRFWTRIAFRAALWTTVWNLIMATIDDDDKRTGESISDKFINTFKQAYKQGNLRWMDVDITPAYRKIYRLLKKDPDMDSRKYFSLIGHFRDPIKFLSHPIRAAKHKSSVFMRMFFDAIFGEDWRGKRFSEIDELMSVDEKGHYSTTSIKGGYRAGQKKGGRLKGKISKWDFGKSGPIEYKEIPSYLIYEALSSMPVQIQQGFAFAIGEADAFDAITKGLGFHTSTSHPTK